MCIYKVMSDDEQEKFLKTVSDPLTCWKTVYERNDGTLEPIHNVQSSVRYHAGVNTIHKCIQTTGWYDKNRTMIMGAHFFKLRADAVAKALFMPCRRRVIRCLIAKKDVDAVGYTFMDASGGRPNIALTIVAHRATFAKTIRKASWCA